MPISQLLCALLLKIFTWNLQRTALGHWSHLLVWIARNAWSWYPFQPQDSFSQWLASVGVWSLNSFATRQNNSSPSLSCFPISILDSSESTFLIDYSHSNPYLRWFSSFYFFWVYSSSQVVFIPLIFYVNKFIKNCIEFIPQLTDVELLFYLALNILIVLSFALLTHE